MAEPPDDHQRIIDADLESQRQDAHSARQSVYTCPDCGGVLWEFDTEFACHTGHRFSPDALLGGQTRELRASLMAAVRALKERAILLRQTAHKASAASASGRLLEKRADADERHAELIQGELLDDDPECSTSGDPDAETVSSTIEKMQKPSED
jgi:two-component system, chemotaxis family, protein-glutamate methylesterase/glutaminase